MGPGRRDAVWMDGWMQGVGAHFGPLSTLSCSTYKLPKVCSPLDDDVIPGPHVV